jgi:hypothetical protein
MRSCNNAVLSITKHIWSIKDLPMCIYRNLSKSQSSLDATLALIQIPQTGILHFGDDLTHTGYVVAPNSQYFVLERRRFQDTH